MKITLKITKFFVITFLLYQSCLANTVEPEKDEELYRGLLNSSGILDDLGVNDVYWKIGAGAMKYDDFKVTKSPITIPVRFKIAPVYNIGIGYKFTDSTRGDINVQYVEQKNKYNVVVAGINYTTKIKDQAFALMLNGYYDINFHKRIIPYVTAGVGLRKHFIKTEVVEIANSASEKEGYPNLIWNVGVGTKINLSKQYSVDFEYRYLARFKSSKTGEGTTKRGGHQGLISLVYRPINGLHF